MRITRIAGPPKKSAGRPNPPPIVTPQDRADSAGPAARPDRRHVRPSSYVVMSLLFSSLLFVFFLVNDRGFLTLSRQRHELALLHTEVRSLDEENRRLEAEIAALKDDPKAVEKIAREDLNLVKPGEIVLVLPEGWRERVSPKPSPKPVSSSSAP